MLENIELYKQQIIDILTNINTDLTHLNIKVNLQPVLDTLNYQLNPLNFYTLKKKVDDANIFLEQANNSNYELLAEIGNMGLITYYLCNARGDINTYPSLLLINDTMSLEVKKNLKKKLEQNYILNLDFEQDYCKPKLRTGLAPIVHNKDYTEDIEEHVSSPLIKAKNILQNSEDESELYIIENENEALKRANELKEFNAIKSGKTFIPEQDFPNETINKKSKFRDMQIPASAFNEDYTN